jgi:Zn finger protein HypA/HybF involved in hydrogenase expression
VTHEIMIAREIAEKVRRAAEETNAKGVVAVELEVGDLAFLDTANIEMWLRQALADGPGRDAAVRIDTVASTLTSADCDFHGQPEIPENHDHHLPLPSLECPRCGSANVALEAKADCVLKRIELEV